MPFFSFRITIDHRHFWQPGLPISIQQRLDKIMSTQAELAAALVSLKEQTDKSFTEIIAKIAELEEALNNAGTVSPEVLAALDALKVSVQRVDDIVPDA